MNVVHLNTDDQAGASRSASRLHLGLMHLPNVNSFFVVGRSKSNIEGTHTLEPQWTSRLTKAVYSQAEKYLARPVSPEWQHLVSFNRLPRMVHPWLKRFHPDIVNLHWIGNGLIPIGSIARFQVPVVWTMHDMWSFTGGCHYDHSCGNYVNQCDRCPMFSHASAAPTAHNLWRAKHAAFARIHITFVCPSQWLASCARQSSLLKNHRIEVIPYGLDTLLFKPSDKMAARRLLGLPSEKKILLFGAVAADKRKGLSHLVECLERLRGTALADRIALSTFGKIPAEIARIGFPIYPFGTIRDDAKLASIYAASDLFVAPSEQDNLPNTVLEAMACGLPCIAFRIGGMPDLIGHQSTGYLAEPMAADDLVRGIDWVLASDERRAALGAAARNAAQQNFPLERQANDYARLYEELLQEPR
jgi:glycosyltransferase involved in cell wall biosynthesis